MYAFHTFAYTHISQMDVDWEILEAHFLLQDPLDIDFELNGGSYRRDGGAVTRQEMQGDGGVGGALGLLTGLCGIAKGEGFNRVEEKVPTRETDTTTTSETSPDFTRDSSGYTAPTMYRVQEGRGDRRRSPRPVRVHNVWPDPVTGCVDGCWCALQRGSHDDRNTCVHTQVLQSRILLDRLKVHAGRQFSPYHNRRVVPFASRCRWESNHRRGKQTTKGTRHGKKI